MLFSAQRSRHTPCAVFGSTAHGVCLLLYPRGTMSHLFINRPILATVISIIHHARRRPGRADAAGRPVSRHHAAHRQVSAIYPGANAQVVAETVAAPIEQQVNGVENMMYMSSQCTNDGTYTLTVTFQPGTDLEHRPGAGAKPRALADADLARPG